MMRSHCLCLCLVAGALTACSAKTPPPAAPAPAASRSASELERIDVFGSARLDRAKVLARWGDQLALLLRELASDDEQVREQAKARKARLEAEILASGGLAFVELAVITYFPPAIESRASYMTVSLVDADDRARRMSFAPLPTGTLPDPDGLLALWRAYDDKREELLRTGQDSGMDQVDCPFWHCFTFTHPDLAPFRDAFARRVPAHERELVAVLREDHRGEHRATAAFLLAHIASGPRVVQLMVAASTDASRDVRNNAMRVLSAIADDHPKLEIPLAPIFRALQFPSATDRNKASAILIGISKHASREVREQIRIEAGATLVDMLALRQPNNHEHAYMILKQISGQDFGEHAVDAWRAWVTGAR